MSSYESDSERAIRNSAEGVAPPPSRKTTPSLTDDDPKYHDLIVAIDEAGMLPSDWAKCNMFDYEGRPDILVNFYVKDPAQDETYLVHNHLIYSLRVTEKDDLYIIERT